MGTQTHHDNQPQCIRPQFTSWCQIPPCLFTDKDFWGQRERERESKKRRRDDGLKTNNTILWQRLIKAAIQRSRHTHTDLHITVHTFCGSVFATHWNTSFSFLWFEPWTRKVQKHRQKVQYSITLQYRTQNSEYLLRKNESHYLTIIYDHCWQ